jgi:hypothetical protein
VTVQKLAWLAGVAGVAVVALLSTRGQAADRPGAAATGANPMADIADLYAWVSGSNLNLVMDVSPLDDGMHSFDPSVQYVFHLTSKTKLGVAGAGDAETRVILRFASDTEVDCWVTDASGTVVKAYVFGDPSHPAGLATSDGKVKLFAGRRSDPAFRSTTGPPGAIAELARNRQSSDVAGCPALLAAEASTIQGLLTAGSDSFAASNVMAIVVQIDKGLVNVDPNKLVAVWASTHAGS